MSARFIDFSKCSASPVRHHQAKSSTVEHDFISDLLVSQICFQKKLAVTFDAKPMSFFTKALQHIKTSLLD
ncbi:hypothetical protein DR864_20020 [Runella rosea]|uniref:Uncharacterized protein n=1 Tax=Runella rosea TaxID=2259595 RepID=A0A344TMJ7_9BACT|nr:hypothetical protein DR864_20020 [Runella rosea]